MARSGLGLVGATLFCVYACAKATDSDLGGGAYDPHAGRAGSGAKPGTAGSGGSGGTGGSSTGGTAGRGGSSGGGAGTGTGGASSAGTGASGGKGGSGNTTSTGGTVSQGGQAGDDGVPPDVLENAQVVLRYIARNSDVTANAVDTRLFFENKSDDALDLAHVLVRYWTTPEAEYGNLKCYHSAIGGTANVVLELVDAGQDTHVDITFIGGEVPAHNTPFSATEFQMKLDAQGGGQFNQGNDWSFDAALTGESPPQPNPKIAVYLADKLVWGCERKGKCAGEDGAGGAGGQGGQGGEPGMGGTSGTGAVGPGGAGQGGEPSAGQGGA